jgi:hypothetical protein
VANPPFADEAPLSTDAPVVVVVIAARAASETALPTPSSAETLHLQKQHRLLAQLLHKKLVCQSQKSSEFQWLCTPETDAEITAPVIERQEHLSSLRQLRWQNHQTFH